MKTTLTARQQRECDFYEEYAKRSAPDEVPLDAALGTETRPWNAYWFVCELVKARYVAGDQKLLDFGCGHGYYSVLFAKMGYEVYGVDIAPQNIAHANLPPDLLEGMQKWAKENGKDIKFTTKPFRAELDAMPQAAKDRIADAAYTEAKSLIAHFRAAGKGSLILGKLGA